MYRVRLGFRHRFQRHLDNGDRVAVVDLPDPVLVAWPGNRAVRPGRGLGDRGGGPPGERAT